MKGSPRGVYPDAGGTRRLICIQFGGKNKFTISHFGGRKFFNPIFIKYILYARKSTEEDDRQVLSIEAQLIELQEYATKEKLEIVASFQEAKTAKEPREKHRLEPYFYFGGRKFFNHKSKIIN